MELELDLGMDCVNGSAMTEFDGRDSNGDRASLGANCVKL